MIMETSNRNWMDFVHICAVLVKQYYFWVAVASCALIEPFLCAYHPTTAILTTQIIVLFVAAFLFVVQSVGDIAANWDEVAGTDYITSSQPPNRRTLCARCFSFLVFKGRNVVEFVCFVTGFVFIWRRPGIAALRCFRAFRLLWFYEDRVIQQGAHANLSMVIGDAVIDRTFALMQFAIRSLTALGNEMFRFTNKTKGGLILMLVFFYSAFVFGAALWMETGHALAPCQSLGRCTYTMMRLTFYDGEALDYAYDLSTTGHNFLFVLVMIYMCVTAFGILNGLVGLFGTAFNQASMLAFETNEEYQQTGKRRNAADCQFTDAAVDKTEVSSTLTRGDLAKYRQLTGREFDIESATSPADTTENTTTHHNGGGGLFDQQQFPPGVGRHHSNPSDMKSMLAYMEKRFRSQHEDIVHMLLLQNRMALEIQHLSAHIGADVDPMIEDPVSGKMVPVKPVKGGMRSPTGSTSSHKPQSTTAAENDQTTGVVPSEDTNAHSDVEATTTTTTAVVQSEDNKV